MGGVEVTISRLQRLGGRLLAGVVEELAPSLARVGLEGLHLRAQPKLRNANAVVELYEGHAGIGCDHARVTRPCARSTLFQGSCFRCLHVLDNVVG